MTLENMMSELEHHCRENNLLIEDIRNDITVLIGTDNIVSYYITKGHAPHNPNVSLDLQVLSNDFLYGLSVEKEMKKITIMKKQIRDITTVDEEKKDNIIEIIINYGLLGWVFYDDIKNIKKIRQFKNNIMQLMGAWSLPVGP